MRIAYLITRSDTIGGPQVHVRDICRALSQMGHTVAVFTSGIGPYVDELKRLGIETREIPSLVRNLDPYRDFLAFREIKAAMRSFRPDLISAHSSKAGLLGRLAGRSMRIPTIFTAHGWAFSEGTAPRARRLYTWMEKAVAPATFLVISVSDYDRQLALTNGVLPKEKIVTVHNGMPDVPVSRRSNPAVDPVRIAMVARMELPKDHAALLRALSTLATEHPNLQLDFVGDGPLRPSVEAAAASFGVSDRVRFLGFQRDVSGPLAEAQIFVLLSRHEGFPRSIVEAMRAGLPVVASDVGGIREAVVDGETGFLVPRGAHDRLCRNLSRLAGDAALRGTLGANGRRRYEAHFTFETMLTRTLQTYERLLSGQCEAVRGLRSSEPLSQVDERVV